jgi:hypothetical protein
MRADMFKVIVERPRWRSTDAPSVKLKKDRDQDRKFIGLNRHVHEQADYWKSLNENLAPLVRFLRKQRGRRWDDVFSEICAGLDSGSTVKMHVRMHLEDFVLVRISRGRKGELLHEGLAVEPNRHRLRWYEFYVDPDDGILKDAASFWKARGQESPAGRNAWRKSAQRETCADLRWVDDTRLVLRRGECWFLYEMSVRPKIDEFRLRDALLDGSWRDQCAWSVIAQHQLSKRELKHHQLANGGAHD